MNRLTGRTGRIGLSIITAGLLVAAGASVSSAEATTAPTAPDNALVTGVAAPGARNAWVVGGYEAGAAEIWHWNGSTWSRAALPASPPWPEAVAAQGGSAWAVGENGRAGTTGILRLLKGKWIKSPSPRYSGWLDGVAIAPGGGAWAVGVNEAAQALPLILRWNGSTWSTARITTPPAMVPTSGVLEAVTAPGANSAWAVGGDGRDPLIFHWDGHHWSMQFPASVPGNTLFGTLYGVAASSPDNVWAVGNSPGPKNNSPITTLIMHWDGHRWSRVPSPNPSPKTGGTWLSSVAVTRTGGAWAVGYTMGGEGVPVILHWDGHHWTRVPSPDPYASMEGSDGYAELTSVAAVPDGTALTVGWAGPSYQSLILRWNGHVWVPDPLAS